MHELTVCFDPGKHTYGIAMFDGRRMIALDTRSVHSRARPVDEQEMHWRVGRDAFGWVNQVRDMHAAMAHSPTQNAASVRVIVEWPRIYDNGDGSKDPNALLWLCASIGAFASHFSTPPIHVAPAAWKGQVPKEVMTSRILKRFACDPQEWILCETLEKLRGTKAHHALDAAGMGLWASGRMG